MCHDFSARGLNPWDMISSGLGHAMSHRGSDTLPVIPAARYFYNEPKDKVCINSVNASEHSVSTTKIFTVGEKQMIIDWLKEFPTGILSIVADTFDLWKLLTEYIADPEVKELIMNRNGTLVIRPDSGDPVDIICGKTSWEKATKYCYKPSIDNSRSIAQAAQDSGSFYHKGKLYTFNADLFDELEDEYGENVWEGDCSDFYTVTEISNGESKGVIELLWDTFGGTVNDQGYKVLDPHIGAIYGDAITLDRQVQIYSRLADKGFAATNIVLGVGSFTYQFNTRDTFGFAAKGGWFETDEKAYNIYKDPITDDGTKKSPKGLLQVKDGVLKDQCTWEEEEDSDLRVIFENGKFYNQTTLTEIRKRLNG
jgi:nicotinamide phosphoribosyltransferase